MAIYVIVKALSHAWRLNDARNCTKISIAKNAQVGSEERNICKDIMHESAATKIGLPRKHNFRHAASAAAAGYVHSSSREEMANTFCPFIEFSRYQSIPYHRTTLP